MKILTTGGAEGDSGILLRLRKGTAASRRLRASDRQLLCLDFLPQDGHCDQPEGRREDHRKGQPDRNGATQNVGEQANRERTKQPDSNGKHDGDGSEFVTTSVWKTGANPFDPR
ncbi:hypothetical protein [Cupriavidus yeoncheonensis]|uniref:hypothetical protein n=1 Tax=Cupriavidus yeoncheonensis TaxID=1462994 RepID=UPI001BA6150F|nr:hypothetical protein [Cupriavidus yeoncheonensis]